MSHKTLHHHCGYIPLACPSTNKCIHLRKRLDLPKPKSALAKCFVLPLLQLGQDHTHAVAMTSAAIVHMVAKVPLRQW